jgi:hypothetical protein
MRLACAVFILVFVPLLAAEPRDEALSEMEGAFTQRQPLPTAVSKPGIDAFTWTLLGADAVSRTVDAYSTHRMLKNECGLEPQTPGLSTCNYEKYLPHSVSHNVTALYAFEGSAWLTQYFVVKLLVQHHHPRLARFVPVIDIAVTAPFAINNLTFPIAGHGAGAAMSLEPIPLHLRNRGVGRK